MRVITIRFDHWPQILYPQTWTVIVLTKETKLNGKHCKLLSFNGRVIRRFNSVLKHKNKVILAPGPYLIWNNRKLYSIKIYSSFDLRRISVTT